MLLAREITERPHAPSGVAASCQPRVKLHILPLVWISLLKRGSMGAQGAAAGGCLALDGHALGRVPAPQNNNNNNKITATINK